MTKEFPIFPNSLLDFLSLFVEHDALPMLIPIFPAALIVVPRSKYKSAIPMLLMVLVISIITGPIFPFELASTMHLSVLPFSSIHALVRKFHCPLAMWHELFTINFSLIHSSIRIGNYTGFTLFLKIDIHFLLFASMQVFLSGNQLSLVREGVLPFTIKLKLL